MRPFALLITGILVGSALTYTVMGNILSDGHDHDRDAYAVGAESHDHSSHDHAEGIETSQWDLVPEVKAKLTADAVTGYNLHIETSHFDLVPPAKDHADSTGEGHAHLYVNGEKIARVYGHWFHISSLPKGQNTITVSLNGHNHEELLNQGVPIVATLMQEGD
jgi:hypothetical protein